MPPSVALVLWVTFVVALLRFDPARERRPSVALWVPTLWIFIMETRLPSQWLGGQIGQAAVAMEEGNPIDRVVYAALIVLAIGILVTRSFDWGSFFTRNLALTAFVFFALVSVCWSDFPLVAFKRWFRDLGNYLAILVALSDPRPMAALRTLLRRVYYLLLPLSVLLIKYYPAMGKQYDFWSGVNSYVGATTSKNMLGALCLVAGLFFFWDTLMRWPERKQRQTKKIILVNGLFMAQTLWLLNLSNSATSRVCLLLGCVVIAAARSKSSRRRPNLIKWMIPAFLCLYVILAFGLDLNSTLAGAVGRDPTFTGRTNIWNAVLSTHTNWLVGTGYESFWLGPRLSHVWALAGTVNEAHNGYLELYLTQGVIGLLLLAWLLISTYRAICGRLDAVSDIGPFGCALWTIALFYNMTESAFKAPFMCLTFLLGTLVLPRARRAGSLAKSPEPWPLVDHATKSRMMEG
jgi:exopolysaccharide production protein ExoQ